MRRLALAVLLICAASAAVAAQPPAKVQLPCDSSNQELSPSGAQLLVYCKDHSVHLANLSDGNERLLYPAGSGINELSFSQDGKWLAAGFHDGTVEVLPAQGTGASRKWQADSHRIDNLYFFADGKMLFVGPMNTPGTIWDLTGTPALHATLPEDFGGVFACAVSPDGKVMVAAGGDTVLRWYDTATWQKTREYRGFLLDMFTLKYSPDGKYLLAGGADSHVTIFDGASGKELRQLPAESAESVGVIDFLGDKSLVMAEYYNNAGDKPPYWLMWNLTTGKSSPLQINFTPTCGGVIDGKLWLCNTDGKTLAISQHE